MGLLFGSSRRDQVHLLSTLQSLNPTSVAGLAAALSWSERKTERTVRSLATGHAPLLVFDPHRRMVGVRHRDAAPTSAAISGAIAAPATPAAAPTAVAPGLDLGPRARCLHCDVPLVATSSGGTSVCPECGRLSSRRVASTAAPVEATRTPPPHPTPPPAPIESGRTVVHEGDRRSQELFAAWVTARPIPCPRCRTALRHRGVGEYGCPSCGHRVAFETSVAHLSLPRPGPSP